MFEIVTPVGTTCADPFAISMNPPNVFALVFRAR